MGEEGRVEEEEAREPAAVVERGQAAVAQVVEVDQVVGAV